MRIALCFSGQIRSFDKVKKNLEKFILYNKDESIQIDTFLHTYYKYDDSKYINYYDPDCLLDFGNFKDINFNKIIDLFKPVSFKFEYPSFEENSKSMFYSIYKCNELKKEYEEIHNFKYDIVVRLRFDFFITDKINYEIGDELHIIDRPGGRGGLCDIFSYSSSKTMDIYTLLFKEYQNDNVIKEIGPEKLNEEYIIKKNISIKYINKTFFSIIRKNGEIMKL